MNTSVLSLPWTSWGKQKLPFLQPTPSCSGTVLSFTQKLNMGTKGGYNRVPIFNKLKMLHLLLTVKKMEVYIQKSSVIDSVTY